MLGQMHARGVRAGAQQKPLVFAQLTDEQMNFVVFGLKYAIDAPAHELLFQFAGDEAQRESVKRHLIKSFPIQGGQAAGMSYVHYTIFALLRKECARGKMIAWLAECANILLWTGGTGIA